MTDFLPTDKVAAGGLGGAVSIVIIGVLSMLGVVLDPTLVAAAVTLITFAAGWLKTETKRVTGNGTV